MKPTTACPRLAALSAVLLALSLPLAPSWGQTKVNMNAVDEKGVGKPVGTITVTDSQYGLVLTPALAGLPPGLHGFHVHEHGSCDAKEHEGKMTPGQAAGGHYDPSGSKKHGAPWGDGHLGDLPAMLVDSSGNASLPVLAPRLKVKDLQGRALMIHAGGDNYADQPKPLGGGGARIACGAVK